MAAQLTLGVLPREIDPFSVAPDSPDDVREYSCGAAATGTPHTYTALSVPEVASGRTLDAATNVFVTATLVPKFRPNVLPDTGS